MKRLFTMSALTSSLLVAGGLGLASCNDELDLAADVATLPDDLANDLTCGWNLLIWNADTLQQCSIPLNTKLPVVVKSKNSNLSYEQVPDGQGRSVLRPHYSGAVVLPETMQSDQLHLYVEGHPELGEKVVNLFLHPNIKVETRADNTDFEYRVRKRAYDVFRRGLNYGAATLSSYAWFEFSDEDLNKFVEVNTVDNVPTTYDEETIDSYSENLTQFNIGGSFSASFPTKIGMLSLSVSAERTTDDKVVDKKHYLTGTKMERAANVTIDWLELQATDTNNGLPRYFGYLTPAFNNALNNPGTSEYLYYNCNPAEGDKNETDGIYRLLQDFGTVYPVQAVLGGKGSFMFESKEHLEEHSMSYTVSIAAGVVSHHLNTQGVDTFLNKEGVDGNKLKALVDLQKLRTDIAKEQNQYQVKAGIHWGEKNLSVIANMQSQVHFEYIGGKGGKNPADWECDKKKPEDWAVIDYIIPKSGVSNPMKSIEQFISNKTTDRYRRIKAALEILPYPKTLDEQGSTRGAAENDDNIYYTTPFYHYLDSIQGFLNVVQRRMVLADLVYVRTDKTKDWEAKQFKGPDGKVRTYYPLRANIFSPEAGDVNYRLNTDGEAYVRHHNSHSWFFGNMERYHNKYNHAWYYALDYEDECPGVLEIQFLEKDENQTWWRNDNGVRNDDGCTYDSDPFLWVGLKLGQGMKTPYEDKIKAIGLYAYEGRKKGCVFGATPMWNDLPSWAEENSQETKNFKELWQKEWNKGNHTNREFATYGWKIEQDTRFKLVWSKEPLIPIRSYYKVVGGVNNNEAFKNALPLHPQKK